MAPTRRDGAGSSCMGAADHSDRAVLGSMLVLGEPLAVAMDRAAGRSEGRGSSAMKADIVRTGQNDKLV